MAYGDSPIVREIRKHESQKQQPRSDIGGIADAMFGDLQGLGLVRIDPRLKDIGSSDKYFSETELGPVYSDRMSLIMSNLRNWNSKKHKWDAAKLADTARQLYLAGYLSSSAYERLKGPQRGLMTPELHDAIEKFNDVEEGNDRDMWGWQSDLERQARLGGGPPGEVIPLSSMTPGFERAYTTFTGRFPSPGEIRSLGGKFRASGTPESVFDPETFARQQLLGGDEAQSYYLASMAYEAVKALAGGL